MVACLTHKNDERRSRKPHEMEAYVGLAQSGDVWDKMATRWAGKNDWMIARKKQNSPEYKYNFITYILNKMLLSTEHRKTEKTGREHPKI